jgi:hypothetical protein
MKYRNELNDNKLELIKIYLTFKAVMITKILKNV